MAISVDRVVLNPQYASNCFVVRSSPHADEAAVVDPGGDAPPLFAELDRLDARVAGILVTHADVDHVAGVAEVAAATGADTWAPAGEADDLRAGETRGGMQIRPHDPEHLVADGDTITVAGIEFEVVGIAGHSRDHVAFATEGSIFAGDLLFAGSVGRVDFPGGDWDTLLASIRRLNDRFGADAVVYPGHGEPTTLGRELATNPFLAELRAAP
ncbi:MAG TPA: MBL fold metallo-hydrolase [Gaiellaceae bacterium]|jgi:glyoxylase-like metal-dependent hydrolase (beta-lactamase superfamily II)|nr:MBL fold metallo-hydrolase [Gaiellaceae bacterium]